LISVVSWEAKAMFISGHFIGGSWSSRSVFSRQGFLGIYNPDNAETRVNVGGGWLVKPGCLLLPSLLEHYIYNRMPRNHANYFIYPTDEPFGTSGDLEVENGESISFGANGVGLGV